MNRGIVLAGLLALVIANGALAQQVADLSYQPPIAWPGYQTGSGPRVAIDEAHGNFHTANGRYQPFAELLRRDGYRVGAFTTTLTADSLATIAVLVIANPLNPRNAEDWSLPTPSAFTPPEIAAVRAWVEGGGSLFLIADHMPFPGAAGGLASAFGVTFSNGYAVPAVRASGGADLFTAGAGLVESAVTRGRRDDEAVTAVATFGGSAFRAPANAIPILVFGAGAESHETTRAPGISPGAPRVPIAGWCQGALLNVGAGRVAVFGEAAMFSAQLAGPDRLPMGMNAPRAAENHRLLLNVMHWLTRAPGTETTTTRPQD